MVVTYLQGGLGNQLFQVSASIGYVELWGQEWLIQSDFTGIDHFNIPKEKYIDEYALPRYSEPSFHFQNIPYNSDYTGLQLFGYFQSDRYFKHCNKLIRHLFECPYAEKIKWKYRDQLARNTVAVHVRRGDYVTPRFTPEGGKIGGHDNHYNLETEYYTDSIRRLKLLLPDAYTMCFSDDIAWCKTNITADYYVSDDMFMEFHLMSYCKHFIIANSSFSWWTSYLSTNKEKIVIAPPPQKWFGEKKKHLIVADLYQENWIHE